MYSTDKNNLLFNYIKKDYPKQKHVLICPILLILFKLNY